VKIYRYCVEGKSQQLHWTLVAQEATLTDGQGRKIGRYFDGATWKFDDGSIVVGKIPPKIGDKGIGKIYWLVFDVAEARGEKVKDVRYVKSVETTSGLAPTEGYKDDKVGDEKRVLFRAEYSFYADWPQAR